MSSCDSLLEEQIIQGLKAAKNHEKNKVGPPLCEQEDMMNDAFPMVPKCKTGRQEMKQLTEMEYEELRSSMQSNAAEHTSKTLYFVQEQITEYHDVLERLASMEAHYQLIQRQNQILTSALATKSEECKKCDDKILSLERELFDARQVSRYANGSNTLQSNESCDHSHLSNLAAIDRVSLRNENFFKNKNLCAAKQMEQTNLIPRRVSLFSNNSPSGEPNPVFRSNLLSSHQGNGLVSSNTRKIINGGVLNDCLSQKQGADSHTNSYCRAILFADRANLSNICECQDANKRNKKRKLEGCDIDWHMHANNSSSRAYNHFSRHNIE